jgi:hypothetical protein
MPKLDSIRAVVTNHAGSSEPLSWDEEFAVLDGLPEDASQVAKAARGRQLEKVLHAMFDEAGLAPRLSYRPKGEEIDGSFVLHHRTMLLEAKWTSAPHPASSLYQFRGKVDGKLVGTLGLFISMGGFSTDAMDALIAGKQLNLVLADGDDIRAIAAGKIDVVSALDLKLRAAAESGTPYLPVARLRPAPPAAHRRILIVDGAFDADVLRLVADRWGDKSVSVINASGPANIVPLARAFAAEITEDVELLLLTDQDASTRRVELQFEELVNEELPHGVSAELLVLNPHLEGLIGLTSDDATWEERRRLRRANNKFWHALTHDKLVQRAELSAQLDKLIKFLGVQ